MNKIAIVGDTHFGYGSELILESQLKFFKNVLFPYCKKNNINTIIQTGDWWDNRRNLDIIMKNKVYDLLENEAKDFKFIVYLGNHDVTFKNTNSVNSLRFLKRFSNFTIIEEITEMKIYDRNFLFVPWLYELDSFKKYIDNNDITEFDACFGHFDTIGSKMSKTSFSKNGLTKELLFKFKMVFSGHYHSYSTEKRDSNELTYVGTPYQLNRGDEGEDRGFCILHCSDMSYEFVENDVSIKYVSLKYPETFDEKKIKGNIIDIYISNNDDIDQIQSYIDDLNKFGPAQEPTKHFIDDLNLADTKDIKVKNVKDMFDEYIGQLNINEEIKDDVIEHVNMLYEESQKD